MPAAQPPSLGPGSSPPPRLGLSEHFSSSRSPCRPPSTRHCIFATPIPRDNAFGASEAVCLGARRPAAVGLRPVVLLDPEQPRSVCAVLALVYSPSPSAHALPLCTARPIRDTLAAAAARAGLRPRVIVSLPPPIPRDNAFGASEAVCLGARRPAAVGLRPVVLLDPEQPRSVRAVLALVYSPLPSAHALPSATARPIRTLYSSSRSPRRPPSTRHCILPTPHSS